MLVKLKFDADFMFDEKLGVREPILKFFDTHLQHIKNQIDIVADKLETKEYWQPVIELYIVNLGVINIVIAMFEDNEPTDDINVSYDQETKLFSCDDFESESLLYVVSNVYVCQVRANDVYRNAIKFSRKSAK